MLRFIRWFLVSMVILFLTACGGGGSGSSGGDNGGGSGGGNLNCINISRPSAGQVLRYKNESGIQEKTIIEYSNTSSSVEMVMTDGPLNGVVNYTSTYSISNNYKDITKMTQQNTFGSTSSTTTIEFSPFQRIEIDKVCKDQAWTSSFKLTASTSTGGANYPPIVQDTTTQHTIESINETKSVAAGTFNTYRKRMVVNGAAVVTWIDIETGAIVYEETYSDDGVMRSTMELLSIE